MNSITKIAAVALLAMGTEARHGHKQQHQHMFVAKCGF